MEKPFKIPAAKPISLEVLQTVSGGCIHHQFYVISENEEVSPPEVSPPMDKKPTMSDNSSGPIKYKVEYTGKHSGTYSFNKIPEISDVADEYPVFEHIEVRWSSRDILTSNKEDIMKTDAGKGNAYINILSPAVMEALRCVVDYFPEINFSESIIKIYEPYTVFVFFEQELTKYRKRLVKVTEDEPMTCVNQWADKHLGIVQDFVRQATQQAITAERERHSRGYVSFDMLWLLYKPGEDVYFDRHQIGEHDPYVVRKVDFSLTNGTTDRYTIGLWNMCANSTCVGPSHTKYIVDRFPGEKQISSLRAYPCDMHIFMEGVEEDHLIIIREQFINRGKKWYDLRREARPLFFDGYEAETPRRSFTSPVIVDPRMRIEIGQKELVVLSGVAHPASPAKPCPCQKCAEQIYRHAVKPKFLSYENINPLIVESLTEHQYFLCDQRVETFVFKARSWNLLHVDGFREPTIDGALFERLVMKEPTKDFIKKLTRMYIRHSTESGQQGQQEAKVSRAVSHAHEPPKKKESETTWSADFIEGKGEGLTILLHGRPGVGKTYTAECIADYTGRPLLSLTCSDIGVKPDVIEKKLLSWFNLAEMWGCILLIDEADIYMEQRQVQDLERNHLVAGFLRALEYFKGILFLTTNRVGTFDEAFISRIHVQIYYPEFVDADRDKLWDTFFQKLEDDRETTMRVQQSAKDYVQSQEMRSLMWNGREIRNAFQVAVALAEAEKHKDKEGRTLIQKDHLQSTVRMSREFRDYLGKLNKGDLSKKATVLGHRYDAFGKEAGPSDTY